MSKIEQYLESLNGNLDTKIYNEYINYGFDSKEIFKLVLENLLENVYNNISIIDNRKKRLSQQEFSEQIRNLYKCCVITGTNMDECEAAHIIPVAENGSYSLDNGLLLSANIHKTFDRYLWSINPTTHQVEVKKGHNGTIKKYENMVIKLEWTNKLTTNMAEHYNKFFIS